jgi:hypothetical protein
MSGGLLLSFLFFALLPAFEWHFSGHFFLNKNWQIRTQLFAPHLLGRICWNIAHDQV